MEINSEIKNFKSENKWFEIDKLCSSNANFLDSDALSEWAFALQQLGRHKQAIQKNELAEKKDPLNPYLLYQKGYIYYDYAFDSRKEQKNLFLKAKQFFQKAIEEAKKQNSKESLLFSIQYRLASTEKHLMLLKRSTLQDLNDVLHKYKQAIEIYQNLDEDSKKRLLYSYQRAQRSIATISKDILKQSSEMPKDILIDEFIKVKRILEYLLEDKDFHDKHWQEILNHLIDVLIQLGLTEKAIELAEPYWNKREMTKPWLLEKFAIVLCDKGHYNRALQVIEDAMKISHAEYIQMRYGDILLKLNQVDKAISTYKSICNSRDRRAKMKHKAALKLADIYYNKGEFELAKTWANKANLFYLEIPNANKSGFPPALNILASIDINS